MHVRVFVNSVEGYESVKNYASQVFCGTAGIGGHASRTMGQSEQRIRLVSLSVSVSVSTRVKPRVLPFVDTDRDGRLSFVKSRLRS